MPSSREVPHLPDTQVPHLLDTHKVPHLLDNSLEKGTMGRIMCILPPATFTQYIFLLISSLSTCFIIIRFSPLIESYLSVAWVRAKSSSCIGSLQPPHCPLDEVRQVNSWLPQGLDRAMRTAVVNADTNWSVSRSSMAGSRLVRGTGAWLATRVDCLELARSHFVCPFPGRPSVVETFPRLAFHRDGVYSGSRMGLHWFGIDRGEQAFAKIKDGFLEDCSSPRPGYTSLQGRCAPWKEKIHGSKSEGEKRREEKKREEERRKEGKKERRKERRKERKRTDTKNVEGSGRKLRKRSPPRCPRRRCWRRPETRP
ncbi:hypothetical protein VTK73DRAFT_345 [Phialemonium thermophilum]|uniref:Uncharacterized protein n=1 Tax=Phialemonium thermophilum TaxID=223376 RepID=A0ABR3VVP4_9PEZI